MTKKKAAPAAAAEARVSKTIFVTPTEWAELNENAERRGRKVSRHLVFLNREDMAKAK